MRRTIVLLLVLVFLAGFAFLTLASIVEQGVTAAAVISIFILILVGVGVVGALRNPPREK
jgi:hypothetical protein